MWHEVDLKNRNKTKFGYTNAGAYNRISCAILTKFSGFVGTSMAGPFLNLMWFWQGVPKFWQYRRGCVFPEIFSASCQLLAAKLQHDPKFDSRFLSFRPKGEIWRGGVDLKTEFINEIWQYKRRGVSPARFLRSFQGSWSLPWPVQC